MVDIYVRTVINSAGLHYVPNKTLLARKDSDFEIDIVIKDLSNNKEPLDLTDKTVEFIVRKNRHPVSQFDILLYEAYVFQVGQGGENGKVTLKIPHSLMDLPASEYWYDLHVDVQIGGFLPSLEMGAFTASADSAILRKPIGKFVVSD